ncbi:MAG: class I SAM-dependent methyltransferase, partial [Bacteroidales bacterium]|nr:class I SAM-dependent methyltransferase [Bacteroidales bacterium]
QSDEYISHKKGSKGITAILYGIARSFTLRSKYSLVKKYSPGNSILDIGCGTGEFLNFCQQKKLKCIGVEPSEKARTYAKTNYYLDVRDNFIQGVENTKRFDCITLWHVLEHIHQLDLTLEKINSLLTQEGVVIIAVPNSNSYDAGFYGIHWAAYDLPRHIYHFTRDSMRTFEDKYHFNCLTILPQKLDAFYISLLSEKYKNGSIRYLHAFFRGLISNFQARNPEMGYSSQIYILKRKIS